MTFYRYLLSWDLGEGAGPLTCLEFEEVRVTPQGHWIRLKKEFCTEHTPDYLLKDRWIYKAVRGHFAHQDKDEALASFIVRKEYELGHVSRKWMHIRDALRFARGTAGHSPALLKLTGDSADCEQLLESRSEYEDLSTTAMKLIQALGSCTLTPEAEDARDELMELVG